MHPCRVVVQCVQHIVHGQHQIHTGREEGRLQHGVTASILVLVDDKPNDLIFRNVDERESSFRKLVCHDDLCDLILQLDIPFQHLLVEGTDDEIGQLIHHASILHVVLIRQIDDAVGVGGVRLEIHGGRCVVIPDHTPIHANG